MANGSNPGGTDTGPGHDDLKEILSFDPFGPKEQDGSEGAEGGQGGDGSADHAPTDGEPAPRDKAPVGDPGKEGDPARAGDPPPPPSDPAGEAQGEGQTKPDPRDIQLAELRGQVQTLLARQTAPEPKPQGDPKPPEGIDALPDHIKPYVGVQLPAAFHEAMESDEPETRRAAVNGLIAATMVRISRDMTQYVDAQLQKIRGEVPTLATGAVQQQSEAEKVWNDFHTSYPVFNKPMLAPLTKQAMLEEAQARIAAGQAPAWNDEFKGAVAKRLATGLGFQLPDSGGGQQQQQAPAARRAPKATFTTGSDGGAPRGNGAMDPTNPASIL